MKKILCMLGAATLLAWPATTMAQFSDDFESYALGSDIHGQGGWKGWDNTPAAGAIIVNVQNHTAGGSQSVDINGGSDLIHEHTADAGPGGVWEYTIWQYIPQGFTGTNPTYWICQNIYNDGGPYQWSVQVGFDSATGRVQCDCGDNPDGVADVFYLTNQWVELKYIVSFDTDWVQVYYNGSLMDDPDLPGTGYSWTAGVFGGDTGGALAIGATDLFAFGGTSVYYDDINIETATSLGSGACCEEVSAACNDAVDQLACFGPNLRFELGNTCGALDPVCGQQPIGACCVGADNDTMTCLGDITETECADFNTPPSQISRWLEAELCGSGFTCPPVLDPVCPVPNVFCQVSNTEGEAGTYGVSDAVRPLIRYEDYDLTPLAGFPIGSMRFWGINLEDNFSGECIENPTVFNIIFYPDNGSGEPDVNNPACQYLNVSPVQTATNAIVTSINANLQQFDFDLEADSGCCNLENGWISIQGVDPGNGPCTFLWSSSGGPTGGSSLLDTLDGSPFTVETFNLSLSLSAAVGGDPCVNDGEPECCQYNLNRTGSSTDAVDFDDLAVLLGLYTGPAGYLPCPPFRIADFDQDCNVDFDDLSELLGFWTDPDGDGTPDFPCPAAACNPLP